LALLSKKRSKKNKRKNRFSYRSKPNRGRSRRGIIKKLISLTALLLITFSLFSLINQKITEIQYVNEIKRVSLDDLSAISSKIYNKGFLQIGLSEIKEEIEKVNWVKSASLERRWPNQINIYIEEEQIIGRWNNESIMNSKGTLFILNQQTLPKGPIEFYGPDGQEEKFLKNIIF
jgi:Cell division septal protein